MITIKDYTNKYKISRTDAINILRTKVDNSDNKKLSIWMRFFSDSMKESFDVINDKEFKECCKSVDDIHHYRNSIAFMKKV
jgi:hypothetical protein